MRYSIIDESSLRRPGHRGDRLAGYPPIVDRLLAKQPQDRYQSARELFATIAI